MSSFEHTIVIQRPPEEVFTFIHDFEGISRWQPHVHRVEAVHEATTSAATNLLRSSGATPR